MPARRQPSNYDGTTGRSDHGGRRTHIIQILRDSREPLSVAQIAEKVGIHLNTARFHLQSLVDAGMATREVEAHDGPGRPKVVYTGTLPNQTHEQAQGFRLLSEILTTAIAQRHPDAGPWLYQVGREWGSYLTTKVPPFATVDELEITTRLVDKLDALWFAPELKQDAKGNLSLVLHNCPFADTARRCPAVVCQLHAGMINGSLAEMRSKHRLIDLYPLAAAHQCVGEIKDAPEVEPTQVTLHLPESIPPALAAELDDE